MNNKSDQVPPIEAVDHPRERPSGVQAGPVLQSDRIVSLDVLRGFAVLGILVMNIQAFSMIGAAYMNPTVYGDLTGLNYLVWLLSHMLADSKFMTIFSMLFGAGIVLMTERQEKAGRKSAGVHYRRTFLLLIIGLAHAYLLWYGDILYAYAMCGFVVFLFRRCRPVTLLFLGFAAITFGWLLSVFFQWSMQFWPPEQFEIVGAFWNPSQADIAAELEAYRSGWLAQAEYRIPVAMYMQTMAFISEVSWRAGGLMLVGMGLFKLGVFSAGLHRNVYRTMIILAVVVGLPIVLYGIHRHMAAGWAFETCFFAAGWFNYWGSILVSLGYVGAVMLAFRRFHNTRIINSLAAAGQMALTNYLLQTLICTTIFYGHGLGLFGRVERVGQIPIVFAIWIVQLLFSVWWLKRFRFGPFEWLWRSMTYMKLQPLRR